MQLIDVRWFCGRTQVGIVQVNEPYEGIKYYIASPPGDNEDEDTRFIADWGSTFPKDVGDVLFGVDDLRNGNAVQVPQSKEQAEMMIRVASHYLELYEKKTN
jgi:hypothetical protein